MHATITPIVDTDYEGTDPTVSVELFYGDNKDAIVFTVGPLSGFEAIARQTADILSSHGRPVSSIAAKFNPAMPPQDVVE